MRKTGKNNTSRSKRKMSPVSLPGSWRTCLFTTSPSPIRPLRMSSSRRSINNFHPEQSEERRRRTCASTAFAGRLVPLRARRIDSYVQNLPTTLASQLGGTVAVPRQPHHVPALLAGLPYHLSRRLDEHRPEQRQRE